MNKKRNITLEILKLFAAYMVIFIHVLFYGAVGAVVDSLAKFAVPFFFLVSGFYSYKITPDKIKKRIIHIVKLFLIALISYTFFDTITFLLNNNIDQIAPYFSEYLNPNKIINLILFNAPIYTGHLWYLLALIYVYIIFYFTTKYQVNEKVIFKVSVLLLFLQILLGEGLSVFDIILPIPVIRNFALTGIPFFMFGLFAKKYENKLCNIPNFVLIIAIVVGGIESIISRYFIAKGELYIGSLFILFSFVVIFIKYSNLEYPRIVEKITGCSTYIYIFHFMVYSIIERVYVLLNLDYYASSTLQMIHPIIVCIFSTIVAYGIIQTENLISEHRKKKQ